MESPRTLRQTGARFYQKQFGARDGGGDCERMRGERGVFDARLQKRFGNLDERSHYRYPYANGEKQTQIHQAIDKKGL